MNEFFLSIDFYVIENIFKRYANMLNIWTRNNLNFYNDRFDRFLSDLEIKCRRLFGNGVI